MDLDRHTATARERYVAPAKRPAEAEADGQISDSASQMERVADPQSAAPAKRRVCRKGLRNAEARYRRLLQGLPAVVCELAADGRTLSVNAAASRVLGYQPAELLGQSIQTLVPEARRPMHAEHLNSFMASPGASAGNAICYMNNY